MNHLHPTPETIALQTQVLATLLSKQQLRHASSPTTGSYFERCHGAVLFVDVSGFTALTETFAQAGRAGSEQLSLVIRKTFDQLIATTYAYGGDVIAFAGDAIWALWPVFSADAVLDENALREATLAATRAAITIQAKFALTAHTAAVPVRIRATVGIGQLSLHSIVSGPTKREFVATGPAIDDAGAVGRSVVPGEVFLSPSAARLTRDWVLGRDRSDGTLKVTEVRKSACALLPNPKSRDPAETLIRARAFLPDFVLQSVDQWLFDWLAEFRYVSVVFVRLHESNREVSENHERLSIAIRSIHTVVNRYGGERYQLLMDEKGLTCIVAFGLPFSAAEDNATRSVRAALDIEHVLLEQEIVASIGCAAGTVFCSVTGNEQRRAYVMTGSTLNLAARLMQSDTEGILCDHHIRTAVSNHAGLAFEALPPRTVPGRSDPILVYRPSHRSRSIWPKSGAEDNHRLVGRHRERLLLATTLDEYLSTHQTRVIVIEGEPGIGKSCLMGHLVEALKERNVTCLLGAGDSLEVATNYHAIRSVILGLIASPTPPADLAELAAQLHERIAVPSLFPFVPLLRDYLPLPLEENGITLALSEEGRANRLRDLLLSSLSNFCKVTQAAILIEDAHWLDDASFTWLLRAVRTVHPLLVVLTTRTVSSGLNTAYEQLVKLTTCRRIVLPPLAEADTLALLCERLHVDTVPSQVIKLISSRAAGNPFFTLELFYALRDQQLVSLSHARCSARAADLATAFDASLVKSGLPTNLQGIVGSRFDRLSLHQQWVLKVASVIGQAFDLQLFRAIAPLKKLTDVLENVVTELAEAGFLRVVSSAPEATFAISHALLQEAIYESIPYAQRRSLHASIANWYEGLGTLPQTHTLLAHHYGRGGQPGKALLALEAAGAEAQKQHYCIDAARLYARALQVFDECDESKHGNKARPLRGKLELALGRAQVSWSNYTDATLHLEQGLALLGSRVPRSPLWVTLLLVRELFIQVRYRLRKSSSQATTSNREHWLAVARAYEGLAECYFNGGANLLCLFVALASLNRAERAGPSAALARGYSSFGAILGFVPLETMARAYCQRALSVAAHVDDREAMAWVAVATGVFEAGLGNWTEASRRFAETEQLGQSIGDPRRIDDSKENQVAVAYLQGRWRQGLSLAERLLGSARLRDDWVMQASALRSLAYGCLWTDQLETAASHIAELRNLRTDDLARHCTLPHVDVQPLSALLHFRRGDFEQALHEAKLGVRAVQFVSPLFYATIFEYWTLAEVLLSLRERKVAESNALSRAALKLLKGFARIFPIAKPASLLSFGFNAELAGRHRPAQAAYEQALTLAESLNLPYWQALAHYRLATSNATKHLRNLPHLPRAVELFSELGENHYLTLAHRQLEADKPLR